MWVLGVLGLVVAGPCMFWWWRALGPRARSEFSRAGDVEPTNPNDAVGHAIGQDAWLMLPND